MSPTRLLVFAGTSEARELCSRLDEPQRARTMASLAGETATPASFPCRLRTGHFGGREGLKRYLAEEHIEAVIDATHPFSTYSRTISAACDDGGVPCLRLVRPPWQPGQGDHWHPFGSVEEAARALPEGSRVLATTGRKSRSAFAGCRAASIHLRVVDPPTRDEWDPAELDKAEWGEGRSYLALPRSPTVESERDVLSSLSITHLITKNSGGVFGRAKLDAARELAVEVFMVDRPAGSRTGDHVETVAEALEWLSSQPGAGQDPFRSDAST